MMGHSAFGFGYGGGFLMPFMMIAFWALLIIGAIYILRLMISSNSVNPVNGESVISPLDVLKLRYAKGELTKEDYEGMKRDIS